MMSHSTPQVPVEDDDDGRADEPEAAQVPDPDADAQDEVPD
jgi:hypothetical protein